jgi:hypothetical protein
MLVLLYVQLDLVILTSAEETLVNVKEKLKSIETELEAGYNRVPEIEYSAVKKEYEAVERKPEAETDLERKLEVSISLPTQTVN